MVVIDIFGNEGLYINFFCRGEANVAFQASGHKRGGVYIRSYVFLYLEDLFPGVVAVDKDGAGTALFRSAFRKEVMSTFRRRGRRGLSLSYVRSVKAEHPEVAGKFAEHYVAYECHRFTRSCATSAAFAMISPSPGTVRFSMTTSPLQMTVSTAEPFVAYTMSE